MPATTSEKLTDATHADPPSLPGWSTLPDDELPQRIPFIASSAANIERCGRAGPRLLDYQRPVHRRVIGAVVGVFTRLRRSGERALLLTFPLEIELARRIRGHRMLGGVVVLDGDLSSRWHRDGFP